MKEISDFHSLLFVKFIVGVTKSRQDFQEKSQIWQHLQNNPNPAFNGFIHGAIILSPWFIFANVSSNKRTRVNLEVI